MSSFGDTISRERSRWLSDATLSPQRRDTLAVIAREHETGVCDIQIGIFNFIDTVYRQALFITFACCKHDIGNERQWTSLSEQPFLVYFKVNVPEEGKDFLREKFREEPVIRDCYTQLQFAAMAQHFHTIFGLGPAPGWIRHPYLKRAKLLDIAPLVNRLIRQAVILPQERAGHIRTLNIADYAATHSVVAALDAKDYQEAARLLVAGIKRENARVSPGSRLAAATLP